MSEVAPLPVPISWDELERLAAEGPTEANMMRLKAVIAALNAELPEILARARANGRPMLAFEAQMAGTAADEPPHPIPQHRSS